jgi:hypothetical protein
MCFVGFAVHHCFVIVLLGVLIATLVVKSWRKVDGMRVFILSLFMCKIIKVYLWISQVAKPKDWRR